MLLLLPTYSILKDFTYVWPNLDEEMQLLVHKCILIKASFIAFTGLLFTLSFFACFALRGYVKIAGFFFFVLCFSIIFRCFLNVIDSSDSGELNKIAFLYFMNTDALLSQKLTCCWCSVA